MIKRTSFEFDGPPSQDCYDSSLLMAVRQMVADHDLPCPEFEVGRRIRKYVADDNLPITMGIIDLLENGTPLVEVLVVRSKIAGKVNELVADPNSTDRQKCMGIVDMIASEQELCRWSAQLN